MSSGRPNHRGALVSARSHLWFLDILRENLSAENMTHVRNSCFGPLFDIPEIQFQGQLFNVMCRRLQASSLKRMVLQYRFGNHFVEFGTANFAIMTGLKFNGSVNLPKRSQFHETVLKGDRDLRVSKLEKAFENECKRTGGSSDISLKLGYLYIVFSILLLRDRTQKRLQLGYIHLIDDLDRFLRYPWGKVAYDFMVPRMHNAKVIIGNLEAGQGKLTVEAYGFVTVVQAWAYEVMPDLAAFCEKRVPGNEDRIPRMIRWSADNRFYFEDLWDIFLPSSGFEPVAIVLSPQEFEMLERLGIPAPMHCASPSPIINPKSLKKRRLQFSDSEQDCEFDQRKRPGSAKGKEKVVLEDRRRSSRLRGVSPRRGKSSSARPSPAISKNHGEASKNMDEDCGKGDNNELILLIMELMRKVESLENIFDSRMAAVEKTLQMRPQDDTKECNLKSEKQPEASDVHASTVRCDESPERTPSDPLPQKAKAVPSSDQPMKKKIGRCAKKIATEAKSESSMQGALRRSSRLATQYTGCMETEVGMMDIDDDIYVYEKENLHNDDHVYEKENLPPMEVDENEDSERNRAIYDPSDADFKFFECDAFKRWQSMARGGDRQYDRRIPIKMLHTADVQWFDLIWKRKGWLESEHLNALMYLLLVNFNKNSSEPIYRDWTCLEMGCWSALSQSNVEELAGTLMPYVRGTLPSIGGLDWTVAKRVFGIAHVNDNHWVFYEIVIKDQKIVVYDSLNLPWSCVAEHFDMVRKNIPIICRMGRVWERCNYPEPQLDVWSVVRFPDPPQQPNSDDCGIFCMKYMECRAYGVPVADIDPERGGIYRRRYCARLFEASFEA